MSSSLIKLTVFTTFFPAMTEIKWRPGIGDPTAMGWITVAAYLAVWWMTCRASLAGARIHEAKSLGEHKLYWLFLAVAFLFLAINKQIDLQSLFTELARDLVQSLDLYDRRRELQQVFIVSVLVAGASCVAWSFWYTRRSPRYYFLANLGLVYLLAFIVVRAASFHNVDRLLGVTVLGIKMNWFFELGGIACVGVAARQARVRAKTYRPKPAHGANQP